MALVWQAFVDSHNCYLRAESRYLPGVLVILPGPLDGQKLRRVVWLGRIQNFVLFNLMES